SGFNQENSDGSPCIVRSVHNWNGLSCGPHSVSNDIPVACSHTERQTPPLPLGFPGRKLFDGRRFSASND
ncbi:MAG: hypothetical protein ACOYLD_15765, partial [Anaerohalosphaeraceae bacterium]